VVPNARHDVEPVRRAHLGRLCRIARPGCSRPHCRDAAAMTAPVLSPVRWWRDDATRYVTRGPQTVPAAKPDPAWMFELLAPLDPAVTLTMERWFDAIGQALFNAIVEPQTPRPSLLEAWNAKPDIMGDLRRAQANVLANR
jgi:hypothetical protein